MQISATEVARLLTAQRTTPSKTGSTDMSFLEITPDSLPKASEPEESEVARVLSIVAEVPDVREDIVMELKARIEIGEYKVSGEEIAEMLVRRMNADRIR